LLPDPYETQWAYVRSSKIRGAKEGLFARRDMPSDFVVAFYNGVRLTTEEADKCKEDWEANAYKILDMRGETFSCQYSTRKRRETFSLGKDLESGEEGVLDIPLEYVATKRYKASLAHKANHSFTPNARFSLFDHPRFGLIPAIVTTKEVCKDDEVTVSYDYAMDDAPPWYQELFAKRIADQYKLSRAWNF